MGCEKSLSRVSSSHWPLAFCFSLQQINIKTQKESGPWDAKIALNPLSRVEMEKFLYKRLLAAHLTVLLSPILPSQSPWSWASPDPHTR